MDEEEAPEIASSIEADRESKEAMRSTEAPSETKAQEEKTAEEGDRLKSILTVVTPIAVAFAIAVLFFMKKRRNGVQAGSGSERPADEDEEEYEI